MTLFTTKKISFSPEIHLQYSICVVYSLILKGCSPQSGKFTGLFLCQTISCLFFFLTAWIILDFPTKSCLSEKKYHKPCWKKTRQTIYVRNEGFYLYTDLTLFYSTRDLPFPLLWEIWIHDYGKQESERFFPETKKLNRLKISPVKGKGNLFNVENRREWSPSLHSQGLMF